MDILLVDTHMKLVFTYFFSSPSLYIQMQKVNSLWWCTTACFSFLLHFHSKNLIFIPSHSRYIALGRNEDRRRCQSEFPQCVAKLIARESFPGEMLSKCNCLHVDGKRLASQKLSDFT